MGIYQAKVQQIKNGTFFFYIPLPIAKEWKLNKNDKITIHEKGEQLIIKKQ